MIVINNNKELLVTKTKTDDNNNQHRFCYHKVGLNVCLKLNFSLFSHNYIKNKEYIPSLCVYNSKSNYFNLDCTNVNAFNLRLPLVIRAFN